ncbi:helix-turn-helix domain-containing protein [Bacillus chungangensis]|uniref:DNA-binding Xre family transcriptional regulator n=1 Tax=Bacillus chungangensis TaxID=587633 RepID=A0ABT9WMC7_9BACI|nr:helix-turn-helix transcriptional regulator [Bacillus chungangensis]MDQ0174442.1 DNA-binding Xre family transcriptional regulator [Bacillus chungangensis]
MISYKPLLQQLKLRKISMRQLQRDLSISSATTTKLSNNQSVTMSTIEKICLYLDVPIEQVVRIVPNESDKQ